MPDRDFIEVAAAADIPEGGYVIVEAGEHSVLLAHLGGGFFALENRCSHVSSPLAGGRLRRGRISCPLHGAIYDVRTGAALGAGLAPRGLRTFETRLEGGLVAVRPIAREGLRLGAGTP
jgi:nitrite reductase/ring-hydroxylating ferredoxin subunit